MAHQMLTAWNCLGNIKANMDHAIKFGREMSSICVFFLTCNATTKLVSKISLRMRLRLAEKNREKILQWQKHARTTGLRPSLGREISPNEKRLCAANCKRFALPRPVLLRPSKSSSTGSNRESYSPGLSQNRRTETLPRSCPTHSQP